MRIMDFFLLLAAIASLAGAQVIGDFECQGVGQLFSGTPDCEGWINVGGFNRVAPDGSAVNGPCGAMPASGSQWADVNNILRGPASPVVPPSTPGIWPFVSGTVSEIQLSATVPPGGGGLAVDWSWSTVQSAGGNGGGFDDFAQIAVIDPATGTVITVLLYVDTYAPNTLSPNSCPSTSGATYGQAVVPAGSATATIPAAYAGAGVLISVVCANQGSAGSPSSLFFDNLRFTTPATFPGSGQDLAIATSIGLGTPPNGADLETAVAGDILNLHIDSPGGTYDLFPFDVAGGFFPTGAPPTGPSAFPEIHLAVAQSFLLIHGSAPGPLGPSELLMPGGNRHLYLIPAGLAGNSVLLQAVVLDPMAANGFFAISDGHEIAFM